MQLLRIGRNLNQAMTAANAAMLDTGDKRIEPELRRIADLRMQISEHVTAVGDAMRRYPTYWTVADCGVLNRPCEEYHVTHLVGVLYIGGSSGCEFSVLILL